MYVYKHGDGWIFFLILFHGDNGAGVGRGKLRGLMVCGIMHHGDAVLPELFGKPVSHGYHVPVAFQGAPFAAVLVGAVIGFKVCLGSMGVVYKNLWLVA